MASFGSVLNAPAIARWFWKADVTICIPAYEAEAFIDRTLRCAQGQTYRNVRVLVSVDHSTDQTAKICRDFAAADRRIEVIEHDERLGWCGNVNALLERVDTPYFFIYFHDDLILPQYCAMLRQALVRRSDAATAHCDLLDFGEINALRRGRDYEGSIAKRILTFWTLPERGQPLRSMIRRERIGANLRLPRETDTFVPGQTLVLEMLTAGPAVRVPATLYLRWTRKGGLTAGWSDLPVQARIDAWAADLARIFALIDQKVPDAQHRAILKFAQTEFVLRKLIEPCRTAGLSLPEPQDLHPEAGSKLPSGIDEFGEHIAQTMHRIHTNLGAARAALRSGHEQQ